jgi:hypothetical protein
MIPYGRVPYHTILSLWAAPLSSLKQKTSSLPPCLVGTTHTASSINTVKQKNTRKKQQHMKEETGGRVRRREPWNKNRNNNTNDPSYSVVVFCVARCMFV